MQTLGQKQKTNNRVLRKSHLLIFGSLLVFLGVLFLSWNHLKILKGEVYSDMKIEISNNLLDSSNKVIDDDSVITNIPDVNNLTGKEEKPKVPVIDYDKYLGVLEIPKIGLKRGFFGTDSKYNDIKYNVTLIKGSAMPDVVNGNLILIAHSGSGYIAFFARLYRLDIGDDIYVTYNKNKYHYKLVNIYDAPKSGKVKIKRNFDKTTLTLITCTRNSDDSQTVYIAELV